MPSILISGGQKTHRIEVLEKELKKILLEKNENNPDLVMVEAEDGKKSIGIDQVKKIAKFASEKPYSHKNKAIIIESAEILTPQAQNALLKTLEEAPNFLFIFLLAKTENDLLETVTSRCKRVCVGREIEDNEQNDYPSIKSVIKLEIGEKLAWASETSGEERAYIIEMLENWVLELRDNLNPQSAKNIEYIAKIKSDLENTNVALKLALEVLVLNLK